jgi:hypothetical protein
MSAQSTRAATRKLLLLGGFLSIWVALLIAYLTPATGYEVSIYHGTPVAYWIGLGIALFLAIVVAFTATRRRTRNTAFALGIFSFMSVVMLPLLRGYHYHSGGDGLSHLGFVKGMSIGVFGPTDNLYPMLHSIVVFVGHMTGVEFERAILMVVPAFLLLFVSFAPLTARLFSNDRWVVGVAVFSGMLLLPINHISGDLTPQPSSMAMIYIPFALYVLVLTMLDRDYRSAMLLTIVAASLVLLHPLHAASFILLLVTIAAVQELHNSLQKPDSILRSRPVYLQASFLVLFFWIWVQATTAERFGRNFRRMFRSILEETETAGTAQSRGLSLEALGGSMEEMFVKMFLVAAVFCGICALLMGSSVVSGLLKWPKWVHKRCRSIAFESDYRNSVLAYWTFGFTAASALFLVYMFGSISDQYMRHYGFLMGTVTIIGALAIGQLLKYLTTRLTIRQTATIAIVVVSVALLMSMPVVFSSPYIYQESHHHSETQMQGFETAFENTDDEAVHAGVRRSAYRYMDAVARHENPERDYEEDDDGNELYGSVPDRFASQELQGVEGEEAYYQDLHGYFDEPAYLLVKEKDRTFETTVLQGFRWSEEDFAYLEREPGINRVQDNGELTMYDIENRPSSNEQPS